MQSHYFTRLTPNSNQWKKPSGADQKCCSSNLYECVNGFGWEEWLLEDYHASKEVCRGYIQAFNSNSAENKTISKLHLYTRICTNKKSTNRYVGYIENVKIIPLNKRGASKEKITQRLKDLEDVKINCISANDPMWDRCFNIEFRRSDFRPVPSSSECEIRLKPGQFRFGLYDLSKHSNFIQEIKECNTL
jgi:hypothetical protein